jgi:hypothetical protein
MNEVPYFVLVIHLKMSFSNNSDHGKLHIQKYGDGQLYTLKRLQQSSYEFQWSNEM